MSNYQPGEIVDITIRGARILPPSYPGAPLRVAYHEVSPGVQSTITIPYADSDAVTVERVTPAQWPPRPGDLWRDSAGRVWFGAGYEDLGDMRVLLVSQDQYSLGSDLPDHINQEHGPMTLVHREGGESR